MGKEKNKKSIILNISRTEIFIFFGVGLLLIFIPLLFTWDAISWVSFKDKGEIGDAIGGITAPFIGFGGAILVYLALKAQIDANNRIQEQFNEQKKVDYQQNFENTFFNMLTIHHDIVKNIDFNPLNLAGFFDPLNHYLDNYHNNLRQLICENKLVVSRDVFKVSLDLLKTLIKDDLILEKLYQNPMSLALNENQFLEKHDKLQKLFKKQKITFLNCKAETRFQSIYDKIYYELSTDFGHYFRNVYRIIKMVDEKKFSEDFREDFKVKYAYTSIVRAQLSDDEIVWLFFNCLSNKGSEKFKPLLEKYSILKIINEDDETYSFYSKFYEKSAFKKPKGENLEEHIKKFNN
jgi:hypothetical protein